MPKILIVLGLFSLTLIAGCSFLDRAKTAAVTPKTDTGETPINEIIGAMPRAIALDPTAIASIAGNVAYIILAGLGLVGVGTGAVAMQIRSYKNLRENTLKTDSISPPAPPSIPPITAPNTGA